MKTMPLPRLAPNCLDFVDQDFISWHNLNSNPAVFLEDVNNTIVVNCRHLESVDTEVIDLQLLEHPVDELVQLLSLANVLVRSTRSQEVRLRFVLGPKSADNRIHNRLNQIESDSVNVNTSVVLAKSNLIGTIGAKKR